jgi:hypothetical protein
MLPLPLSYSKVEIFRNGSSLNGMLPFKIHPPRLPGEISFYFPCQVVVFSTFPDLPGLDSLCAFAE